MTTEMYGADIGQLRALSKQLEQVSERLGSITREVGVELTAARAWKGPNADQFRSAWASRHRPAIDRAGDGLGGAALSLRRNADSQERTSYTYESVGDLGGGPWSGGPFAPDTALGAVYGTYDAASNLGVIKDAWKFTKWGLAFRALTQVEALGDAARISDATADIYRSVKGLHGFTASSLGLADEFGRIGKFGTMFGAVGGVFGVVGGFNQMFNSDYDGARGAVDRVMGGVSVVGGAGSIAIALGGAALLGPVGVGIVVGAGVVAGAWALGNAIYDNWDSISAFVSNPGEVLGDALGEARELAGDAVDVVKDVGGDAVEAVGDGLKKAGNFIGGLFS
ncbi:WXG100 family type VII secretion target [Antribacter gilvus]|uniref:WXG100 family type VII secretion target n=1 Tax=Antribacter gilvus TaxID=2304675 RepID=UPI000F7879C8|nr:hypothetical protein [Antribacter gilvus]